MWRSTLVSRNCPLNPAFLCILIWLLCVNPGALSIYDTTSKKDDTVSLCEHLFYNNHHVEAEMRNTTTFTIIPKKVNYLDINLTKHIQELYAKNYKMLI